MITKNVRLFLCLVIGLCAVTQVVILNRHSTSGEQLSRITQQIATISTENDTLSQQIASSSALTLIAQQSAGLGLVSHVQTLSLPPVPPLALAKTDAL